ncbi:serine dehydratase [Bacillus pseudomycoides]|uniref:Serine dehydratase n=1 Tax=Bacillus pseudomycoides TaxID=64104 RepID=A0A2A8GXE8_9BACI|nr:MULTISPECIES: hypothetical protein [Bacillus]MCX2824699.1 serine dehydratase [Bacillus sp. DHT2]AIK37849.1 putative d-serine dehydratase [Bacillus pseudomycoides]AJI18198.1 putative d-serine dehydratase [Bacillus pseudomycoides]EEM05088.1 D-serine dehydratase [Bacillus pseudomycoides]EEM10797.1 D-serine dehydratase [Bacillus pseudomycoides]
MKCCISRVFSQYSIAVGSTGSLGFQVIVHMSVDVKGWKEE